MWQTLTTHARWAQLVADIASTACGIRPDALFREAGVTLPRDDPQARITQAETTALWQAAYRLSGRQDLGLEVVDHFHLGALGPMGIVLMTSATFGDMIDDAFRHAPIVSETWRFKLTEARGKITLSLGTADGIAPITHFSFDALIATMVRLSRDLLPRERVAIEEIHLGHSGFDCRDSYQQRLGAPCRFGTATYGLVLDAHALEIPIPSADAELHRVLSERLAMQVDALSGASAEVTLIVNSLLRAGRPVSRQAVAQRLGMGQRTLLRRLAVEDVTFAEILGGQREALAREWLAEGQSVAMIAERLGYADPSALSRMLKQRTGTGVRGLRDGHTGPTRTDGHRPAA